MANTPGAADRRCGRRWPRSRYTTVSQTRGR